MKHRIAALTASLLLSLPAFAGLTPGAPAPQPTLPGGRLSLAQLKGQGVRINFSASGCGPCRQEIPVREAIYRKHGKLGFTLIGVNVAPDTNAAHQWLRPTPVSFPILHDTRSTVSRLYEVSAMPSTFIIDRKGNVRVLHRSYRPGDENPYVDSVRRLITE